VAPTSGVSGSTVIVTDTTANQGPANARSTTTIFYLLSGSTRVASLGNRSVDVLSSGASSGPLSTTLTLPSNINGTYSVLACADDYAVVAESNESNNCTQSGTFIVSGADLVVRNISGPSSAVSGSSISVTETTANQGAAGARATITRFYLVNGSTRVAILGSRDVDTLTSGTASGPVLSTLPLPTKLVGTYAVLACADDYTVVAEASEVNNCTSSANLIITK
jgi:subtilase family serine protease